ncbi:MAG: ArsC family (seleno)protein [Planctomycetota bacterium]|jgi:arsenate reductase-like glutaredoxin family protein
MARTIDWYYHRKSCTSCAKADAFMARRRLTAREQVDARKVKMGKPQIAAILRGSTRVVASKGSKAVDFDLKRDPPVEKVLYEHLIGPTGNLRAPAMRLGRTLVVGFNEDRWKKLFA